MSWVRAVTGMVRDLGAYVVRTGRWWIPLVIVLLSVTAIVVATTKVVVPTAVYVFF